jgi:hypothetical protein
MACTFSAAHCPVADFDRRSAPVKHENAIFATVVPRALGTAAHQGGSGEYRLWESSQRKQLSNLADALDDGVLNPHLSALGFAGQRQAQSCVARRRQACPSVVIAGRCK